MRNDIYRFRNSRLARLLLGPPARFKTGDTVKLKNGIHVMKVVGLLKGRKNLPPLVYCEWNETQPKQKRKNLFNEDSLQYYDFRHETSE